MPEPLGPAYFIVGRLYRQDLDRYGPVWWFDSVSCLMVGLYSTAAAWWGPICRGRQKPGEEEGTGWMVDQSLASGIRPLLDSTQTVTFYKISRSW